MRLLVLLVLFLFGILATAFALDFDFSKLARLLAPDDYNVARTTGGKDDAAAGKSNGDKKLPENQVTTMSAPKGFDIARVSPGGVSVFAGKGKPDSYVTVVADGTPIGSVKTDGSGEWSLVSEHKFTHNEPALSVKTGKMPVKTADASAAEAGKQDKTAKAVTTTMLDKLEGLVDKARRDKDTSDDASSPADTGKVETTAPSSAATASGATDSASSPAKVTDPDAPGSPQAPPAQVAAVTPDLPKTDTPAVTAPQTGADAQPAASAPAAASSATDAQPPVAVAAVDSPAIAPASPEPAAADTTPSPQSETLPVPIKFVYREANFTAEGRRAATLLLEYLKLKGYTSVQLSGHADERGTQGLNHQLSQDRLDTVEAFLRSGGYNGKLELTAKGETEPFDAIDRKQFSQHDLFELDRRVELKLAQ